MIVITAHQKSDESEYGIELISVYKDMYTLKLTCTDKPSYEVIMSYDEIQEIDKQNLKWIYEYAKNTADMKMLYTYSFYYDPYEAEPCETPYIDSVEATSELNSSSYIENFTIEYARQWLRLYIISTNMGSDKSSQSGGVHQADAQQGIKERERTYQ